MPRLTLGVQKLLDQWVNVNKDHVVYLDKPSQSSNTQKSLSSSRRQRSSHSRISKKQSDDLSVVTASTVSTSLTSGTAGLSLASGSSSRSGRSGRSGRSEVVKSSATSHNEVPNDVSRARIKCDDRNLIPLQELTFEERLRIGTHGTTYKGKWNNKQVAIKVSTPIVCAERWDHEISKLSNLQFTNDENVTKILGSSALQPARGTGGEIYCLTIEYIDGISLADALELSTNDSLNNVWEIMEGIAKGMSELHVNGIVHGNLKPGNVLITGEEKKGDFQVKLSDYGIASIVKKNSGLENENETVPFIAPEVTDDNTASFASDVYSFAHICWCLFTGQQPPNRVEQNSRPAFPDSVDPSLVRFLERCWHQDPQERPSFVAILETLQILRTKLATEKNTCILSDDLNDKIVNANYQMSQLSVEDCEQQKVPESKFIRWTSSKKNLFLRRASFPTNPTKCKENVNISNAESMTVSHRKRLLRIKRPKRNSNKPVLKPTLNESSETDIKKDTSEKLNTDSDSASITDKSIESETSMERGAPPHKKHAPLKYSYKPSAMVGMTVPQGMKIEQSHIAHGVPLVQPVLLGRDQGVYATGLKGVSTRLPTSAEAQANYIAKNSENTMFFYNHCPKSSCKEEVINLSQRVSESNTRGRQVYNSKNFVNGEIKSLEYVPSIAPSVLKAAQPIMSGTEIPSMMAYHVHDKNHQELPLTTSSNDAIEKSSLPQSISLNISDKLSEDKEVNGIKQPTTPSKILSSGSLQTKIEGLHCPSLVKPCHQLPREESTLGTKLNQNQESRLTPVLSSHSNETSDRLDAAKVLYSQFSAKSNQNDFLIKEN